MAKQLHAYILSRREASRNDQTSVRCWNRRNAGISVKRVLKVQSKQLLDGKSPLSVFRYSSEETVDIPFKKRDERSRFIERLDSADDAYSYTGWDLDEKPAFHSIGTEHIEPEPPGLLETIRSFLKKGSLSL